MKTLLLRTILAALVPGALACSSPAATSPASDHKPAAPGDDAPQPEAQPEPPAAPAPPEAGDGGGRKMPGTGAMSTFVVEGDVAVKLRGSAQDYEPGPIPAGSYPLIPEFGDGLPNSGTATCPAEGQCVVKCDAEKKTCEVR